MLTKQPIDISFAEGLDTKTDPKRVTMGKFVKLVNRIFTKGGLLEKRNGYGQIASLPDTSYSYLTTFNGNLTAVGKNIAAYNTGGADWVSRGSIQPLSLKTLPILRNNLNQSAADSAVAPNGLVCTVYLETDGVTTTNKYVVANSVTGQNIVEPTVIPVMSGTPTGGMRVFVLGNNFVLVFTNVITGTPHLQYVSINISDPTLVGVNTDIASNYFPTTTLSWDAAVANGSLYIAWNNTAGGQSIKVTSLTNFFVLATPVTFATYKATVMSVTADLSMPSSPVIYVSFYDSGSTNGYSLAVNSLLNTLMVPQLITTGSAIVNITSAAQNGILGVYAEVANNYAFDSSIPTHYVAAVEVDIAGPTVGTPFVSVRSVGLASKAFIVDGVIYYLAAYQSPYQSTYFLVNGQFSTEVTPILAGKLAYSNGGGYLHTGLPGVTVFGSSAWIAYLFKDLIQAVNKNTNVPAGNQTAGVYSQTGVNLSTFTFGTSNLDTAEIGANLNLSGGFLWMYDGYLPVEQNFFLWPDTDQTTPSDTAAWSTTGGSMASHPQGGSTPDPNPNAYFYIYTYEWTDNQGNAFRSAPSIPIAVTTTGTGNTGSVTHHIPTLRLTMKTANPVKIVIYRWSLGQQEYYQVTSITTPLLNDTTVDQVNFVDTLSDAAILGNNLIYTTGGVVENVSPPGTDLLTLFDTRLWLVDAEDRNLLWYSKQVIEATPVEMSDLFTVFIPPTVQNATGEMTAIFPQDDKLIISKGGNSFVYINGTGPDNTGVNNQYSPPTFITSTVGCSNQKSIVLIPSGTMFQSNKGIWLLNRGLETSYIGAPVEDFTNGAIVQSAVAVPATNQVRFTLNSGLTLMYDYFYDQWGVFVGVPCVSSCIFGELHTFINAFGATYQETPGVYLDGSNPVLWSFKTGPLRLGDLQNYQRAYFFYLLGEFITPHKLQVNIFYDYDDNPSQSVLISPSNYSTPYGSGPSQSPYGQGTPYGGPKSLENWRVFLERQRCMAFAIEIQEVFDSSFGVPAGAGLTLSGLNVVAGFKRGFRPQSAAKTTG